LSDSVAARVAQPRYTRVPSRRSVHMDRRLTNLADQLDAGLIARREFLRRTSIITGGTAAGLHVLRRMATAQGGPKLRVWLFKSYVTAGHDILAPQGREGGEGREGPSRGERAAVWERGRKMGGPLG